MSIHHEGIPGLLFLFSHAESQIQSLEIKKTLDWDVDQPDIFFVTVTFTKDDGEPSIITFTMKGSIIEVVSFAIRGVIEHSYDLHWDPKQ